MKLQHFILVFFTAFTCNITTIYSQSATVTAGGDIKNAIGSVSYSIGQSFYSNIENANITLTEGVQQAFEIYEAEGTATDNISLFIQTFPNPTTDELTLKFGSEIPENTTTLLYSAEGVLQSTVKIQQTETVFDFSGFADGIYYLKVQTNGSNLKIFRLIKN